MRLLARLAVSVLVAAIVLGLTALPVLATIDGPCEGSGVFTPGAEGAQTQEVNAKNTARAVIPLKSSVAWTGSISGVADPSTSRELSGFVNVLLPFTGVRIGTWGPSGTGDGNSGTYVYDLPSVLAGFDVTVEGEHFEGPATGAPTCSGSITLQLEGNNPLGIAGLVFLVVSLAGVGLSVVAVRPR